MVRDREADVVDRELLALDAAGCSFADVVKTTVFVADMRDYAAVNGVYATAFAEPFPGRSAVEAARLPKDALVEIEVVAYRPRT